MSPWLHCRSELQQSKTFQWLFQCKWRRQKLWKRQLQWWSQKDEECDERIPEEETPGWSWRNTRRCNEWHQHSHELLKTPTKLVEEFNEHNNETKANPTIRTTPCNDEQEMVDQPQVNQKIIKRNRNGLTTWIRHKWIIAQHFNANNENQAMMSITSQNKEQEKRGIKKLMSAHAILCHKLQKKKKNAVTFLIN